ncbi:MAG TPA: DUF1028 domain-containing protein [Planctomycetes bacterium]|nr:DUF1028 domain-containing protein [Planctomycetota bacterium]
MKNPQPRVLPFLSLLLFLSSCALSRTGPWNHPSPSLTSQAEEQAGHPFPEQAGHPFPPVATFSIVAYDPKTREWGVAVQSKFIAVGSVVPWVKAGAGAIATQAFANTRYGPEGLALLAKGKSAKEVVESLTQADPGRARRQLGIVDAQGRAASFTGKKCMTWAGHIVGKHFCCQGNILAGPEVVKAMAKAFEQTEGDLGDRMIAALEAGQKAGGDRRGRQSAALYIAREGWGYAGFNDRYRDLRVDDHPKPIQELKRIYALHKKIFRPRLRRGRKK